MKISEFSIKHPVVITMLIIVLAVFGFYSVTLMPTEFMAEPCHFPSLSEKHRP